MSNKNPKVKIVFGFEGQSGKLVDLNELTKTLLIQPTETRELDDWPNAIKHHKPNLPNNLSPRCCWAVELGYEQCTIIRDRFEEMLNILSDKVGTINSLRKELQLITYFVISVTAQHDRLPEMFVSSEIVDFIASVGAELSFDMYIS